jgi:hypothetical protein
MTEKTERGISEAASEKRKRGRPPIWGKQVERRFEGLFPDVKTRRGTQNVIYRQIAVDVLTKDPRFAWLCDKEKMMKGDPHAWKPSILAELGRISDSEELKAVALRICELKPETVKAAVAMIRRARTGKGWEGDALDLANEIIRLVNNYHQRHPNTSWKDTEAALRTALEQVKEAGE